MQLRKGQMKKTQGKIRDNEERELQGLGGTFHPSSTPSKSTPPKEEVLQVSLLACFLVYEC